MKIKINTKRGRGQFLLQKLAEDYHEMARSISPEEGTEPMLADRKKELAAFLFMAAFYIRSAAVQVEKFNNATKRL